MAHRSWFVLTILSVAVTGGVAVAADTPALAPEQQLERVGADFAKVGDLHMEGRYEDDDGRYTVVADITAAGSLDSRIVHNGSPLLRVRVIGGRVFYNASARFWRDEADTGATNAKRLANRWVRIPTSDKDRRELLSGYRPRDLAYCMTRGHGTLSTGGSTTVDGQAAIVIVDAGDQPGTAPSKLYVAASGPALPLRAEQTGKAKPGGARDKRCDVEGETDTTRKGEMTFGYGKPPAIRAPRNAVDVRDVLNAARYPAEERRAFMSSCKKSASASVKDITSKQAEQYCAAGLSCLEERLSYARFRKLAERMYSGARNPDAKIMTECMRVAAEKVSAPTTL